MVGRSNSQAGPESEALLPVPSFIAQFFKNQYSLHPAADPRLLRHTVLAVSEQCQPPEANTWNFNRSLEVYFCVTHSVKQSEFTQLKKLCLHGLVRNMLWFPKISIWIIRKSPPFFRRNILKVINND